MYCLPNNDGLWKFETWWRCNILILKLHIDMHFVCDGKKMSANSWAPFDCLYCKMQGASVKVQHPSAAVAIGGLGLTH
jgi:hypothetical protein